MGRANQRHRRMVLLMRGRPGSPLYWKPKSIAQWKAKMEEGRKDPYQHLINAAREAADEMVAVIDNWESGDLAGAVRCLDPAGLRAVADLLEHHLKQNVRNRGNRLEMHHHPDREMSDYDKMFVLGGQDMAEDGHIEVDDESYTTGSDADGEYVLAWLWVPNEEAVLRTRHRAHVYYQDEEGAKHHLATDSVLAFDEAEARKLLLDKHWDSRLDAASCISVFEWENVPLFDYEIEVHQDDPDDPYDEVTVKAATPEDAIEALKDLYPDARFRYEEFRFQMNYDCSNCGHAWVMKWSCACNDRCPKCDTETEPYEVEDAECPPT